MKAKKCKGTHKYTYGLGCGIVSEQQRKYGLGHECGCYKKWLLGSKEGQKLIDMATLKATKSSRELKKAEKEHNERMRLPDALKRTQLLFNEYIRLRDVGKPCISSGIPWKNDFDAGHFFSVKQFSALRFDYDNCHGQSVQDNRFKEGNYQDYAVNLPFRIGEERFAELLKRAERSRQTVKKWTLEELALIRSELKKKIKELENK